MKKILICIINAILWVIDSDHRKDEEISMDDTKKFTHVENQNFKSDFGEVSKSFRTVPYQVWELKTTTKKLIAADKHRVIRETGECVWLEDLTPGDKIKVEGGVEEVVSCRDLGIKTHMYCVQVNTPDRNDPHNHLYYTDGILSHNTATAGAFLLWYATFHDTVNILIAANVFRAATEIMDRIKFAYEELPDFLRVGVVTYNVQKIVFDNGSKIESTTTTPNSGRGKSISLLFVDELAFVEKRMADEFWSAISPTLACVVGDTKVLTSNGFRTIESFHKAREIGEYFEIENLEVWGKHGIEKVSHGYVSPESNTLLIETKKGLKLEVTPNHPLYSLGKDLIGKMIPSKNLKIGDYLRFSTDMNIYGHDNMVGDIQITQDFSYILGGWIAEGWIDKKCTSISISNTDVDFIKYYTSNTIIKPFKKVSDTRLQCCSTKLVELFKKIGIKQQWKCDSKRVPEKIWECSKDIQASFLRGLFDGDGNVSTYSINLTSTSRELLVDVQLMLLNMGIISSVSLSISGEAQMLKKHILPHGKLQKSARDIYGLNISRAQFKKYQTVVGFSIKRKSDNLLKIINSALQNDDKVHVLPKTPSLICFIEDLIKRSGHNKHWFRKNNIRLEKILMHTSKGVVTHSVFTKFIKLLETIDFKFTLSDINIISELVGTENNKFLWDEIKSITPSKNKTFDFTVPNTHSFLQNGILGSNTGGKCIITSTPNSDEDTFAQIWQAANKTIDEYGNTLPNGLGSNGFKAYMAKWNQHPDRDQKWADEEKAKIGYEKFAREYELQFISADSTLIDSKVLSNIVATEPLFKTNQIRWWEKPAPNGIYLVALDPCAGVGADYAAIQVWRLPDMTQVAEWMHDRSDSAAQLKTIIQICSFIDREIKASANQYAEPEIFWTFENNGNAEGVQALLKEVGVDAVPAQIMNEPNQPRGIVRRGLNTNGRTKSQAVIKLKSLIESGRMKIKSKALISQLKLYVSKGSGFGGKSGEHDDLISALLLIVRMSQVISQWDDATAAIVSDSGMLDIEDLEEPLPVSIGIW
jgi:intein/homing endonuclease